MAEIILFEFPDTNSSVDSKIRVNWEDDKKEFVVRMIGFRTRIITEGPDYPDQPNIGKIANYKFCVGTFMAQFRGQATFPYADQYLVGNHPTCAVAGGCDLNIVKIDVTHETQTNAGDGVAVANVVGLWPDKEYSIDNENWQVSNTFDRLAPGTYTLYVRDSKQCKAQQEFTVNPGKPVSYGLRFFLNFDNYLGRKATIKVLKKFFSSVPEKVCGSGDPVIPHYAFDQDDRFFPIVASDLVFQMVCTVEGQFREFFTYDEREYKIELWDDETGTRTWSGFALPDTYGEPWTAVPKIITVRAIDGLSTLKDRYFVDAAGKPLRGQYTAMQVIVKCLQPLDLHLGFKESDNWYETTMDQTGQVSPLVQLVEDVSRYYNPDNGEPENLQDVLLKMLMAKRLQLMQCEDSWYIHQPNWIVYQENPELPPPPPVYPALSFNIYNAQAVAVPGGTFEGQLTLIEIRGGDPADGAYEYSLNEVDWLPVSGLTTNAAGYLVTGLEANASALIYLRRPNKPQETVSRQYAILFPSPMRRIIVIAAMNQYTGTGNVRITRENTAGAIEINYQVWRVNLVRAKEEMIFQGALTVPDGNGDYATGIGGTFAATQRYDFVITKTTPEVVHQESTPMLTSPIGLPTRDVLPGRK